MREAHVIRVGGQQVRAVAEVHHHFFIARVAGLYHPGLQHRLAVGQRPGQQRGEVQLAHLFVAATQLPGAVHEVQPVRVGLVIVEQGHHGVLIVEREAGHAAERFQRRPVSMLHVDLNAVAVTDQLPSAGLGGQPPRGQQGRQQDQVGDCPERGLHIKVTRKS